MPEILKEEVSNLDVYMSDWRKKFYGQHNPHSLGKIHKNLLGLQAILKHEDTLLDVGCNVGEVYKFLGHQNYEGIDLNPELIKSAKERWPDVNFHEGDLFKLEGKWDVVLASRVLMHVAPFQKAMKKLLSAAKRKLVVFVPIADRDYVQELKLFDDKVAYFRRFSESAMHSVGECQIIRYEPYSIVIYG
mgnify:CR=1 FL=1